MFHKATDKEKARSLYRNVVPVYASVCIHFDPLLQTEWSALRSGMDTLN